MFVEDPVMQVINDVSSCFVRHRISREHGCINRGSHVVAQLCFAWLWPCRCCRELMTCFTLVVVHLFEFWVILPWIIMDHFLCTDGWIFTVSECIRCI